MSIRSRRRLLAGLNAALAAGIVASALLVGFIPLTGDRDGPPPNRQASPSAGSRSLTVGPLSSYAVIYKRNLRKPLFDAKSLVRQVAKPKPRMKVELVGTVLEPGFTYGVFRAGAGQDKLVPVGGTIEGVEVVAIGQGEATVDFNGERITLKVKEKEAGK